MKAIRDAAASALLAALVITGCASTVPYQLTDAPQVYTLVNLHPDAAASLLYSVNYQQDGLIPLCTPVDIEQVTSQSMVFSVPSTGQRYTYLFHSTLQEPIPQHLDRYFGPSCDPSVVQALPPVDQRGIEQGRVTTGMSKDAVILAVGYPPQHATPSLDVDRWRYWKNRWDTMLVYFDGGVVSAIED